MCVCGGGEFLKLNHHFISVWFDVICFCCFLLFFYLFVVVFFVCLFVCFLFEASVLV